MLKSWRGRAAVAAVVAAGVASAGIAMAGPGGMCGGGGHALAHLERKVARAGLPPATAQAVYQRIDQARAEERALEGSLDAAHNQMHTLLQQDNANLNAVLAQADVVGAAETQLHKVELKALLDIRGLVTPAEWQALEAKRPAPPDAPGALDPRS